MSTDELPADVPDLANEALECFDDICYTLGIVYFLAAGTALGFYRDKGYITRDNDIDVRVICDDVMFNRLVESLRENDFIPAAQPDYERMHFRRSGILLDLKRADGSEFWFDVVYYNGRLYKVPYPVKDYLERLYGKDWETPRWKSQE